MRTFAELLTRPVFKNRDATKLQVSIMGKQAHSLWKNTSPKNPDQEAAEFYLGQHLFAHVDQELGRHTPLNDSQYDLLSHITNDVTLKAIRMALYILLITTREARHEGNSTKFKKWSEATGPEAMLNYKFIRTLGPDSSGASGAAAQVCTSPPLTSVGSYAVCMAQAFYQGSYGGGFGGKPWGQIADALVRLVSGDYTGVLLLDTGWTLAHNNGPMFNKGMLYEKYGSSLIRLLDVQNAGCIPDLFHDSNGHIGDGWDSPTGQEWFKSARDLFGLPSKPLDWDEVSLAGAKTTPKNYQKNHAAGTAFAKPGHSYDATKHVKVDIFNTIDKVKRSAI
jgi:hypothetical protein